MPGARKGSTHLEQGRRLRLARLDAVRQDGGQRGELVGRKELAGQKSFGFQNGNMNVQPNAEEMRTWMIR